MEGNYNNLFNYKITYSKKRKKTIGFKVENNILNIISPLKVSKKFLLSFLEKKKDWVLNIIKKNKQKRELIKDNKILFLGQDIEIKIIESPLLLNGGFCELKNNELVINISKNWQNELLKNIIINWYKKESYNIILQRVDFYAKKFNFQYGTITIREQKTVWGSCNAKNNLSFNWKAIFFANDVIDYLVVHELVHTIHKNHSKKYWKAVENILPNYKELNKKLKIL